MTKSDQDAAAYCANLVRRFDEDRWLAARYAPAESARRLLAFYAFWIELQQIPLAVSEPPLGEIRLQWRRDVLAEIRDGKAPRAQPVIEEAALAGLADAKLTQTIDRLIDAQSRPLYGEAFQSIDDLTMWLCDGYGAADRLAVLLLGGDEALAQTAEKAGAAFALARDGLRYGEHIAEQRATHAKALYDEVKQELSGASPALAPAIAHLSLTGKYLRRGGAAFPIAKRLRLFICVAGGRF